MDMKLERVPCFLLQPIRSESCHFYGFHEVFSPVFDGGEDVDLSQGNSGSTPFTSLDRTCNASFTSYRGRIVVAGGFSLFSDYDVFDDYDGFGDYDSHGSHMRTFSLDNFLDDKQNSRIKDGTTYWSRLSSMNTFRSRCHLGQLHGLLYSIGGVIGPRGVDSLSLVECHSLHGWLPVSLFGPELDTKSCVASVGIKSASMILIGLSGSGHSTDSFFSITFDEGHRALVCPYEVECPPEFVMACCQLPGIVVDDRKSVDDTIVVWHDTHYNFIRGLHLGQKQHFYIDIVEENILMLDTDEYDYSDNLHHAKLIGLGDGTLGFIYRGLERHLFIDNQGADQVFSDYRWVTFEIIYHHPSDYSGDSGRVLFPGIQAEARVISDRKCYAPMFMEIQEAFVIEFVNQPKMKNVSKLKNVSLLSIRESGVGLQTILQ